MRFFIGLGFGTVFALLVHARSEAEDRPEYTRKGQKYMPYVQGFILPFYMVLIAAFGITRQTVLSVCFSIFLQISIYYAVLIPLLPFLRRRISARACAMLWLIPNYLYLVQSHAASLNIPMLVITTPGNLVWTLMSIWFAGFVGVLGWKIIAHIRFRRQILGGAEEYADLAARQQWKLMLTEMRMSEKNIPLLVSDRISTPVAVGLFQRTTVVVLPKKAYTREELELIFHHEIVHIGRMDPWNKVFLVFCTAMCWFNPLMWIAMARSAEDLELSCDETVLLDADDDTRKKYAELLLNTAGDGRGFTTCLSASANALRYRLKNIVKPTARSTGAALVGVTFFFLSITCGYVALGYDEAKGSEILIDSGDSRGYVLTVRSSDLPVSEQDLKLADGDGILEYLSGQTMYRITGQYTFSASNRSATLYLDVPNGADCYLFVYDNAIELYRFNASGTEPEYYHLPEGVNWKLLDQLIAGS